MTDRIMSVQTRTASKIFAAISATIMLGSVALAQQAAPARPAAKPAAKPAAPPAAPAPAAQQAPPAQQQAQPAAAGGDQPQLIFSPWVKLCNKDADPKAKRICVTVKDGRVESGLLVVSVKPGQWVAGADLSLIAATPPPSSAEVEATSRRFQGVCEHLAWMAH